MTFTYVYDRMSSLRVACIVVVLLAMTRGSNASCSNIHNDINSTQVATMCTDNVVTGSSVFIDTSHVRNMSLTPGSICTCHAQLEEGTFHVSANFTDNTDSSSCGTYLQFQTDVFSSNISCKTLDPVFQNITNMTVEFHIVSESMNGGYCVQLEQDICANDGFHCTDGTCIPGDNRCDNFPDCPDGSDEENCTGFTCIEGQVPCDDHQTCFSMDQRCDGTEDCPDGSDEILTNCGNDTVTNETSSAPEKSYITIRCKLPASQVSTTTPAATALPTTGVFKTTTPHTDSTSTGTDPPDTSNDNIGLILGIVFGILGGVVVVIGVAVYCWRNYANVKKYALSKIHKRVLGHTGKGSQKVPSAQPGQDNVSMSDNQAGHDYVNTRVTMSEVQAGHD